MKNLRKTTLKVSLFLFLLFSLIVATYLIRHSTKIEKKAELERNILITLNPSTNNPSEPWISESSHQIEIRLTNTSSTEQSFRVVGVKINFDSNVFTVNQESLSCNQPFQLLGENASKTTADSVYIVCYLPVTNPQENNPYRLNPQQGISIGSFSLIVKPNVSVNSSSLNFNYTNIPQETSLSNISYYNQEAAATFYLSGQIAPPTNIPTSTPTPTPTNTPIPPSSRCEGNGDLNLDGRISETDLAILISNWAPEGPAPTPSNGLCSADLNNDNRISEMDILILIKNWKPS